MLGTKDAILLLLLIVTLGSVSGKEIEQFDPSEAILEVVHHYDIKVDFSQRLIYRGDVLFSPMGQLGGWAFSMKKEPGLIVFQTHKSGTARQYGLKKWDRIISVNDKKLGTINGTQDEGPIVIFGHELDRAEGSSMELKLEVMRDGEKMPILVKLKKSRGSFETSDPLMGDKAQVLEKLVLKRLLGEQQRSGLWKCGYGSQYTSYLAGMALLSTGDPKHLTAISKCARACMDIDNYAWTWGLAMNTIFLSEYFWATGDMQAYRKLEELSVELSKCVGPTGGIGHKYTSGTYDSDSFGAPSVLVQLAWSACSQCLVAVNNEKRNQSFNRILGSPSRLDSNNVNYGGGAYRGGIGESAFRTSVFGLSLGLSRWEPQVYQNIIGLLEKDYKSFRYIHSTPSQGTIFSALCLATGSKKGYNEYPKYVKSRLTVAWESHDRIHYIYPKKARFNFPGGGGWGGDSVIGFENVALIETVIILNAKRKKLLIQGNREMGWLKKKDAEKSKAKLYAIHAKEYSSRLKQAEQSIRAGQTNQGYKYLSFLESHYRFRSTQSKIEELDNKLNSNRNWPRAEKKIREGKADEYYLWAMALRATVRGKFLYKLTNAYPNTQAARKAEIKLNSEESRAKKENKNRKKEDDKDEEEFEKQKKEEEKRRRRMKKKQKEK